MYLANPALMVMDTPGILKQQLMRKHISNSLQYIDNVQNYINTETEKYRVTLVLENTEAISGLPLIRALILPGVAITI